MKYYKLNDGTQLGLIVKGENREEYEYVFGEAVWQKSALIPLYSGFDCDYDEVTEEQAFEVIRQWDALYRKLETSIVDKLRALNSPIPDIQTKDLRIRLIYLMYCISKVEKVNVDGLKEDGFTNRMVRGLKALIDNGDMETDQQMEKILGNTYAMLAKYEDIMQNGKKSKRDDLIIEKKIRHYKVSRP